MYSWHLKVFKRALCKAGDGASTRQSEAVAGDAPGTSGSPPGDPPTARTLFAISSSPYSARRDSANLDASIIEVGTILLTHLLHVCQHVNISS